MDENSCKNVDSTLRQTSEEVTHEDNHDVRPRTTIHKARIYKDGNPSSMQTQENPDPQFLKIEHERTLCSPFGDNEAFRQGSFKLSAKVSEVEKESPDENVFKEDLVERNKILKQHCQEDGNPSSIQTQEVPDHKILENMSEENQLLTDKIPMKDEHGRIVCSPSDANEAMRRNENKRSDTVPDIEEEPPVVNISEEKLREKKKILEQRCQELLRSNTLKDEELKTERKKNEEKSAILEILGKQIGNLQTKYDNELLRSNTLKDEELKTERKKNEDKSAIFEILGKQIGYLQTKYDKECEKSKKAVRELEREMARLEEEGREEYDEGNDMVKTQMERTEDVECEKARLEEECEKSKKAVRELEREMARLEEEGREEYDEGNEMVKTQMERTEDVECEKARLEEELKCETCLTEERQIVVYPCGHCYLCEHCFDRKNYYDGKCLCGRKIVKYIKVKNL